MTARQFFATYSNCGHAVARVERLAAKRNNPNHTDGGGRITDPVATVSVSGETASSDAPERREIPPASTHGLESDMEQARRRA